MKKTTTHTFNVINISEYHQSQGGGSVHADFSLLGQKWAESGILLFIQYIWYRMFVYIIDHIYFTNNGSTKINQTK